MGIFRVHAKPLPTLTTLTEKYSVYSSYRSGRATLSLTPDGTYNFNVSGDISETTAKRCPTHKQAENKLTQKMFQVYETVGNVFMKLHQSVRLLSSDSFSLAKNVEPQKFYEWKQMPVAKPDSNEVKTILMNEAEAINHNKPDGNSLQFYETNKDAVLKDRLECWNEINKLFTDIEQAQETKTNNLFKLDYDRRAKEQQDIIDGTEDAIAKAFEKMSLNLSVPTYISLDYSYKKQRGYIDVDIELLEDPGFKIPNLKASYKANGQISVKAKTQSEFAQDISSYQLSLAYYIARSVFNLSPNIKNCGVSIYTSRKVQAICWLEFDRFNVMTTRQNASELLMELGSIKNVSNLKLLKTTVRLEPIDPTKFQTMVQQAKVMP